ncbi:MAG: hypothetical protein EOP84_35210 [Verrucomicrobiaceae bacterium]|nr:MAG: hypothetical protein EOP84_35210 [Verrucomicrobiaceae bacterium]
MTKSTFQISNIGRVSIPSFDLVVHLPLASRLLSVGSTIKPLAAEVSHLSENLADFQQHSFSIPLLEAGDIAEVSMLYDGEHHTMALLRKTDGIQIVLQKAQGFTPPAVELISLAVVLLLFGGVIYMVLSNSLQARLYGLGAAVAAGTIILALIERASSRGRKGQTSE